MAKVLIPTVIFLIQLTLSFLSIKLAIKIISHYSNSKKSAELHSKN